MSVALHVQWNQEDVRRLLLKLAPHEWRFAAARALTETAYAVRDAEQRGMVLAFDRPKPYTVNSLFVQRADKSTLEAVIDFKSGGSRPAWKWLEPEILGGRRGQLGFEKRMGRFLTSGKALVPASGVALDQFGNVPRGLYGRIVRALDAQQSGFALRKGRGRGRAPMFFYGDPGSRGRGIWQKLNNGGVRPMFLEAKQPSYPKRFDWYGIAERTADRTLTTSFRTVIERHWNGGR